MKKKINAGGQAVIEGVMMKAGDSLAISVRTDKGRIITKKERLKKKNKFWKFPFIRGILNLIDMLILGMKALIWSSNQALEEEEEFTMKELILVIGTSIIFVIIFFIGLPYFLTKLIVEKGFWFNLIDGIIRIIIFLAYILVISFMEDIKIMFENHGAEHKAVNCYEKGKKLTVKNAKKYTTVHTRCGTSFIIIVLVISILVFSLITTEKWWLNITLRVLLMPVIASISYEFLMLSARHQKNIILKTLVAPGLWLQKLTTREPNNKQLEVAIKALQTVLRMEKQKV